MRRNCWWPLRIWCVSDPVVSRIRRVLNYVLVQEFGDNGKLYNDILNYIVRYLTDIYPYDREIDNLEKDLGDEVSHIRAQIGWEQMSRIAGWGG